MKKPQFSTTKMKSKLVLLKYCHCYNSNNIKKNVLVYCLKKIILTGIRREARDRIHFQKYVSLFHFKNTLMSKS